MQNIDRETKIKTLLEQALSPTELEIINDSDKHVGHAGAQSGAGHFTVKITCEKFQGKSLVEQHRMVYAVLDEMIGPEIHALSIQAKAG